jgi:hypothetical protein
MAAAMADRIKQARLAIPAHILPLNNPVRMAEGLAMLDYLTGGRLVVGFFRGMVNEDQNDIGTRELWRPNSGPFFGEAHCINLVWTDLGSRLRGSSMAAPQRQNGGDTPDVFHFDPSISDVLLENWARDN